MKFYNPFRPHVALLSNDKFVVRKLTLIGWRYYDNQRLGSCDLWWYGFTYSSAQYFEADTYEEARQILKSVYANKLASRKAAKVWTQ